VTRIPFSFDLKDGFVTVRGVAFLDGDDLVIETTRTVLQLVPAGRRTFRIPADEVESVEVRASFVKRCQLVVRPFSFSFVSGFPGDPADEVVLPIARKHREAAEAFARAARLRNLPH
jgi:hypothetical protein